MVFVYQERPETVYLSSTYPFSISLTRLCCHPLKLVHIFIENSYKYNTPCHQLAPNVWKYGLSQSWMWIWILSILPNPVPVFGRYCCCSVTSSKAFKMYANPRHMCLVVCRYYTYPCLYMYMVGGCDGIRIVPPVFFLLNFRQVFALCIVVATCVVRHLYQPANQPCQVYLLAIPEHCIRINSDINKYIYMY